VKFGTNPSTIFLVINGHTQTHTQTNAGKNIFPWENYEIASTLCNFSNIHKEKKLLMFNGDLLREKITESFNDQHHLTRY